MADPALSVGEAIVVIGERNAKPTTVSLQQGHFIKVTFYRFYDWRKAAVDGLTAGETNAFLTGNVSPAAVKNVALPMHSDTSLTFGETSARAWNGQDVIPARVYTMHPASQLLAPGVASRPELVGTVTRVSTQKRLDSGSGTFSMDAKVFGEWIGTDQAVEGNGSLGSDNSIHKYVDAGDWVEINVVSSDSRTTGAGEGERTLMIGKVDLVSISTSVAGNGGTNTTISITGRDGGSVYEDTPLYFNPYDPAHNNPNGVDMSTMLHDIGGSPSEMVVDLLGLAANPKAVYGMTPVIPDGGLWSLDQTTSIPFDEVVATTYVGETRGISYDPGMISPGQHTPLWQFSQTYGNPQMNEIWVDTLPKDIGVNNGGPAHFLHLFIREKPYVNVFDGDNSPWFQLTPHVINLKEIVACSLSRGKDRYNHMTLLIDLPATFNLDAFAICSPTVNYHSIKRYGLKKLEVTLPIYSIHEGKDHAALIAELAEWRDMFVSWNVLNPYYWEGSFRIAGIRSDLQVGQKIVVEGGPLPNFPDGPLTPVGDGYLRQPAWNEAGTVMTVANLATATTFYVESVSFDWGAGVSPIASTSIVVSRGYPEADRVSHIKALYKLWTDATDPALATASRPSFPGVDDAEIQAVRDGVIV